MQHANIQLKTMGIKQRIEKEPEESLFLKASSDPDPEPAPEEQDSSGNGTAEREADDKELLPEEDEDTFPNEYGDLESGSQQGLNVEQEGPEEL